jgi:tetratricopeptide (TPR) repeat protein
MTVMLELVGHGLPTTDGEIAFINLESARRRSWSRFLQDPLLEGRAEAIVEHERLAAQFVGDTSTLDRLDSLAEHLAEIDAESARTALVRAQIASMTHRFAEARRHLAQAELRGAPSQELGRLRLSVDQACGTDLDRILKERREQARGLARLEDFVALGALLADLGEFAEADQAYEDALRAYQDVSPFPMAWIWFQRGVLYGELMLRPRQDEAAACYRNAIRYLPRYTKACVHLAEIYLSTDRAQQTEALLVRALASDDPEVRWRLADAMSAQGKSADAEAHMRAARSGFESLLAEHLLAFADHGAEFYAGSGDDRRRALELARINVANRPTLRAFKQAHAIAVSAGDTAAASELFAEAVRRWGDIGAFLPSGLAAGHLAQAVATADADWVGHATA